MRCREDKWLNLWERHSPREGKLWNQKELDSVYYRGKNSYINPACRSPNKTAVTIGLRRCHSGRPEGWLSSSRSSSVLKGWVLADGAFGRVCVPEGRGMVRSLGASSWGGFGDPGPSVFSCCLAAMWRMILCRELLRYCTSCFDPDPKAVWPISYQWECLKLPQSGENYKVVQVSDCQQMLWSSRGCSCTDNELSQPGSRTIPSLIGCFCRRNQRLRLVSFRFSFCWHGWSALVIGLLAVRTFDTGIWKYPFLPLPFSSSGLFSLRSRVSLGLRSVSLSVVISCVWVSWAVQGSSVCAGATPVGSNLHGAAHQLVCVTESFLGLSSFLVELVLYIALLE